MKGMDHRIIYRYRAVQRRWWHMEIITGKELMDMLHFGKTKFNKLLKAGELPLVKIGNDYITTESAVEKWINDNIGEELFYE